MGEKLPYYMVYPMPFDFDDERTERRDHEYLRSLYPDAVKRIIPYVEEECDRLEYPGSMIYDEYPDRLQLYMICRRIGQRMRKAEEGMLHGEEKVIPGIEADLIQVLTFQELQRRRKEYRRERRKIYCPLG